MRGFKHIDRKYADLFENGESIQIGTYQHYRGMENDRGDPLEGLAINAPSPISIDVLPGSPISPQHRRVLQSLHPLVEVVGPVKGLRLEGIRIQTHLPDAYIFCCSTEPDRSREEAIFEITYLGAFASALSQAKADVLRHASVRRVSYEDRIADTMYSEPVSANPFKKARDFAFEKEIRIAWDPPGVAIEPTLRICCPKAAKFIRRIA